MRTGFQTVHEASVHHFDPIKGSRFVARVYSVSTELEAESRLAEIRAAIPDATHHCWAYRLFDQELCRCSDDGEPGGSAGRPILAQLLGHEVHNVLIVVSRFYGGVKLGVGGLVRAYGGAAGRALDQVELKTVQPLKQVRIIHSYDDTKAVDAAIASVGAVVRETSYDQSVSLEVDVVVSRLEELALSLKDRTAGRVGFS